MLQKIQPFSPLQYLKWVAINERKKMKKLMMIGVAFVCATVITGCGNPREKMVRELYNVLQSGDTSKMDNFAKENFDGALAEMLRHDRSMKRKFAAISDSKSTVKVRTVTERSDEGGKGALVAAECNGITLYFVVGSEKGKTDKITFVTDDGEVVKQIMSAQ